jgi:hypothetical protein
VLGCNWHSLAAVNHVNSVVPSSNGGMKLDVRCRAVTKVLCAWDKQLNCAHTCTAPGGSAPLSDPCHGCVEVLRRAYHDVEVLRY